MTTITRQQILQAAAQIFREKGFHAASMSDIAQAVNLQKASLYHHISSKQAILVAVLDQGLDLLIEGMMQVMELDVAPDEKLRIAVNTYLEALTQQPDLTAVLLLEHRSLEPKYREKHIPRRDRFETLWRQIIEEGILDGTFVNTDPGISAKTILGIINWTIMWYRPDGELSPEEIANQSVNLFLNGLKVRD